MNQQILHMWWAFCLSVSVFASDSGRFLDRFENVRGWKTTPSDGVELVLTRVTDPHGGAMRMRFDFHGMAGYAATRRALPLELPPNYEITFWIRGVSQSNNLEFKLVDASGDNVWWVNKPLFQVPSKWTKVVVKKRHVTFAWGPIGGGEPKDIRAIEFAIAAGKGGKGHFDIRDLAIRELPLAVPYDLTPAPSASTSEPGHPPLLAIDGKAATAWRTKAERGWFQLDFQTTREFGGLVIEWEKDDFATDYDVQVSEDGRGWLGLRQVRTGAGGIRALALPEAEGRFLKIVCRRTSRGRGWGIRALSMQPLAYASTPNAFFESLARAASRGDYPRGFRGEQPYWTIVGVDGGVESALLGEDGAVETGRGRASVEPFLWSQGKLLRWSDVECTQSLEKNYLPIPTVSWKAGALSLQVTTFGSGAANAPVLRCRYRIANLGQERWQGSLFLAVRPFQVNPPIQFMGTPGGVAAIHDLGAEGRVVSMGAEAVLVSASQPSGFGATSYDQGSITEFLHQGKLPPTQRVVDPIGYASGAFRYDLEIAPGHSSDIFTDIPLGQGTDKAARLQNLPDFQADLVRTIGVWEEKLNRVSFQVPDQALIDTLRTCLAHILISRHGPALQPGTRAYARSWIRDGALISSALLQLGHSDEVRDFIRWYAPRQFANGKIPCVVDERGADPVPENDSHGEFLFLVAEYFRFTQDRQLLQDCWPQIEKTIGYIDTLLQQRRTFEFQTGGKQLFYGLMPESISHEGYSARPVHSYWDDFFTLRGLKDATYLASEMKKKNLEEFCANLRDRFRADLYTSIQRAMARHKIAYLPGCAELGDFDATSTTIALSPGGELSNLPRVAVERTFETYYQEFLERRSGKGKGDRYTPYEIRIVGSFFQLGWNQRANELIEFFMSDRRPLAWNQWPEVVQHDPRGPIFLGDLPHAWVGSDFIRSVMLCFSHQREGDQSLVLGAGLPEAWLRHKAGVGVTGLRIGTGTLNFFAKAHEETVMIEISGKYEIPKGGIVVRWPLQGTFRSATLDGITIKEPSGTEVVIRQLPAKIMMQR